MKNLLVILLVLVCASFYSKEGGGDTYLLPTVYINAPDEGWYAIAHKGDTLFTYIIATCDENSLDPMLKEVTERY